MPWISLDSWPIIGAASIVEPIVLGLHKEQKMHCLFLELYSAETEIDYFQNGGPMKRQKSIKHHSPKPLSII